MNVLAVIPVSWIFPDRNYGFLMDWLAEAEVRAMISAAWLAVLVLAICLLFGRWLKPSQRAWLWLIVAARLALPVAPEFFGSVQPLWFPAETPQSQAARLDTSVATPSNDVSSANIAYQSHDEPQSTDYELLAVQMLCIAWMIGTVGIAGVVVWSIVQCWRKLRRLSPTDDRRLLAILLTSQQALDLRRCVRIVLMPDLQSPAVTGVFRPRILLPEDVARKFSDSELRHIVLHELAHVKRKDLLLNQFLSFLQILHWWNPLFWFVRHQLIKEREFACDEIVVQTIGGSEATGYGRTLLKIVERLSEIAERTWNPTLAGPGLISLLGPARSLKNRLQRLPNANRSMGRPARMLIGALILLAAVTGLTDAQQPKTEPKPSPNFEMPASARFYVASDVVAKKTEKLIVTSYAMQDILDRVEKEKDFNRVGARKFVEQLLLDPILGTFPSRQDDFARKTTVNNYVWYDKADKQDTLVVRATRKNHEQLRNSLEIWRTNGFQQISIEVRFIDSPKDLIAEHGITGGEIYTTLGRREQMEIAEPADGNSLEMRGRSETTTSAASPLYMKQLNPDAAGKFINFCQGHQRINLLFAPKITIFSGQEATISDEVRRPFVVGLRSVAEAVDPKAASQPSPQSNLQPQIVETSEGMTIRISAYLDSATKLVRMKCELVASRVTDVAVGTVGQGEGTPPLSVQIPSVERRVCSVSASIPSSDAILLHPLDGRNQNGKRSYIMITPRVLEESLKN